jgi:GTP pyrophosphokinase
MVSLNYQLSNRDVVEIILAPKKDVSGPSRGWLEFVKTAKARQRIRSWFKRQNRDENIAEGEKLLSNELAVFNMKEITEDQKRKTIDAFGRKSWEDILANIGDGSLMANRVVRKIVGQKYYQDLEKKEKIKKADVKEEEHTNLSGIVVRFAECCKPKKGDEVKGYITKGQGITIHRADCHSLLTSAPEKIIDVDFSSTKKIPISVVITGDNRVGLIRDVTALIAKEKLIVDDLKAYNPEPSTSVLNLKFSLEDPNILSDIIPKIMQIEGVTNVKEA